MHRYTLYIKPNENRSVLVRLDHHPTYRDYPHEIITDEPIPEAQTVSDHIVLDGGGRKVLRVVRVTDDEVEVVPDFRTRTVPFRNAEAE